MKNLLNTTILFLLAPLYLLVSFPCQVLSDVKVPRNQFKIGTNEHVRCFWSYIVKRDQRKNEKELRRFREEALQAAIPPRNLGVYEYKSEYLGTWAFIVDGIHGSPEDEELKEKLVNSFPKLISIYGDINIQDHWAGPPLAGTSTDGPPREIPLSGLPYRRRTKRRSFDAPNREGLLKGRAPNDASDDEMVDSPEPRLLGFKTSFHEMLTVSQPPKVSLQDMRGYRFEPANAGVGVRVYVIDSGCDPSHQAFDYQRDKLLERGSASWIYSGPLPNDEKNDDDLPNFIGNIPGSLANGYLWGYHGTAAAGKVVGSGYGLAPFADLFIVKIQTGRNSVSTELGLLDTLIKVYDDIKRSIDEDTDRSIKGAVISISSLFDLHVDEEDNKEWWDAVIGLYRDILEHFEHINPKVYLVVPAGNEDPGTPIIAYPTSLILNERAEKPGALKQCFVVGGVDRNGGRLFQEDPNVDFYAPAEELAIPLPPIDPKRPHLLDGIQLQEGGTSNATPLVAGLLAMLIGQGEIDPAVQMKAWAYPRKRGGHDVIWNGIREEMWAKAGGEYEPKDRKRPRPQDDPTEDV